MWGYNAKEKWKYFIILNDISKIDPLKNGGLITNKTLFKLLELSKSWQFV